MPSDTFDAGIELGGLRDKTEIRLLICYLLKSVSEPLSKININEIMQEYGLANYFEVNQALNDLLAGGNLSSSGSGSNELFTVTPTGKASAETLESILPFTVRKKAVNAAAFLLTRNRRERENKIDIIKKENGYIVSCSVLDHLDELMTVRLYVTDLLQAENVKEQFLKDPVFFYKQIVILLTGSPKNIGL